MHKLYGDFSIGSYMMNNWKLVSYSLIKTFFQRVTFCMYLLCTDFHMTLSNWLYVQNMDSLCTVLFNPNEADVPVNMDNDVYKQILPSTSTQFLDPIYFYVHYDLWVLSITISCLQIDVSYSTKQTVLTIALHDDALVSRSVCRPYY